MNGGVLIPNLAAEACVEVPALVDGLGVHPVAVGPLPTQLAAYIEPGRGHAAAHRAGGPRRTTARPSTTPSCRTRRSRRDSTLDEAWRLTDELIAAEARVAARVARRRRPGALTRP